MKSEDSFQNQGARASRQGRKRRQGRKCEIKAKNPAGRMKSRKKPAKGEGKRTGLRTSHPIEERKNRRPSTVRSKYELHRGDKAGGIEKEKGPRRER